VQSCASSMFIWFHPWCIMHPMLKVSPQLHLPLFRYDMKFVIFAVFIIIWDSNQSNIVTYIYYCFISEQGRRNYLISKSPQDAASDPNNNKTRPTDEICLSPPVNVISDSVHCIPLTQSTVSSGISCHTFDRLLEKDDLKLSLACNHQSPSPSWVHVFLKTSSTTSLRTQCAAAAYLDVKLPKVLHRRARCAKKKHQKTQDFLREVIVPPNQFSLTCNKIDSEIIVFDGGDTTSPQIKPPDGIQWRCISIRITASVVLSN
jgi:hypothetical protein